tara:strand:- start:71 stop:1384 length:1314 start_codon:yes stop_codon:yes gene_type:complete
MTKTKLHKPKTSRFWKLFAEDNNGKFKIVFKSESKAECKRKRLEIQSESIDTAALTSKRTFTDVYLEFAQAKIDEGKNEYLGAKLSSVKVYMQWYRRYIAPHFDKRILVNEISELVAENFFLKLRGLGTSWLMCENVIESFLTCLKYAKRKEYISQIGAMEEFKCKNQTRLKSKNPSEMKHKVTPTINIQEANSLLKLLDPINMEEPSIVDERNFAIVAVFLFCGLRMSELRGLKWNAIDLENKYPTITIKFTMVGSEAGYGKADGSERTFRIHQELLPILRDWKIEHRKHFTPHKITWVFPSLATTIDYICPVAERTIRDFLNVAYAKLGLAEIYHKPEKGNNGKSRIVCKWSKFGGSPTKTFRHFAATCLWNAQNKHAELTDNFILNSIGHKDARFSKKRYGSHLNINTSDEHITNEVKALTDAIPLRRGGYSEN